MPTSTTIKGQIDPFCAFPFDIFTALFAKPAASYPQPPTQAKSTGLPQNCPRKIPSYNRAMDIKSLIDQFEAGGQKLKDAIAGLSPAQLLAFPVPGTWSIQQIVIHLSDMDLVAVDRMKRIIAEENPLLPSVNESLYVKNLFYDKQSPQTAAELFDLSRKQFAKVLRQLPDSAFSRTGIHTERGKITLEETLKTYVNHLEHHLKFALDKRAMVTK
jgi:hypothetical protein